MSLTHAHRLRAMGCGLKGKLVRALSLCMGRCFEPQRNWHACHKMMQSTVRWVASQLFAAVRGKAAKEAEQLCALGKCGAALVPLQQAIQLGDLASLALKAWLLIDGREGVARDRKGASELAKEGTSFGCHHCQGVLAYCIYRRIGALSVNSDESHEDARSMELAQESAVKGSRYGQHALGVWHQGPGPRGRVENLVQSLAFFRLAAAQGLDGAHEKLGDICHYGHQNVHPLIYEESLLWYRCAASQGHPGGLCGVAVCYQVGCGVRKSKKEAIRWFRLAKAAGYPHADQHIRMLQLSELD
jgi:TPR repeat protein